jgi:hypothetical protein
MIDVMTACVILHNMIIKSERDHPVHDIEPWHRHGPLVQIDHQVSPAFAPFLAMRRGIRDKPTHYQLQEDLVDHLWMIKGGA